MKKPFPSLYDDNYDYKTATTSNITPVNKQEVLELDFSKKQTLSEVLLRIKSINSTSPNFIISIVTGQKIKFSEHLEVIEFLKNNQIDMNSKIVFRGFFHYEMISYLLAFECMVVSSSALVYSPLKLNKILFAIKTYPTLINAFISQYTMNLYKVVGEINLSISELKYIGINYAEI